MGDLEDRLKEIETGNPSKSPMVKSELEKALAEEEESLARDIRMGMAEELIIKHQLKAKQLREQLGGKGGATLEDIAQERKLRVEAELKEKVERIEQTKALYTSCIDAGGDPKRCAEMVAGLIPTSAATAAAPPATSITELVQALKALDDLRGSDRGVGELKTSIDNLVESFKQGTTNRTPFDPVAFAREQAQQLKATYDAMKELGLIKDPVTTTTEGKSLEVVKEENRHEEKMEEVKYERKYKEDITRIASDIPEKIGRGLGSHISEGEGSGDGGGGGLEFITCTEEGCGTKIYITPETGNQITCPKCGMIYESIVKTKGK